MSQTNCPDHDTLQQLLLGKLPGETAERLEDHLLRCDECSQTAETIPVADELTQALESPQVMHGDDEILAQVIERGKQIRCEVETVQSEATVIVSQREQPDGPETPTKVVDQQEIDFLHPPEEPDEIGRLGGYRVLEVLGVGGMGVVFRAEDPKLKRQVALKAMKPAVAASKLAKDRFLKEAEATAAIEHDHIVTIFQVSEDRSIPFIAMQYLRGESLQTRLNRESKFDQREVVRLGRQIALGLEAAHERGLIHRDVKPDNVFLSVVRGPSSVAVPASQWTTDDGQRTHVKIVDFGLVRSTSQDAGLTQSGMVVGTPKYMAPEQAEGQTVDHRCDLFSLGSVLYHLSTGRAPFDGPNLTATLLAVTQASPTPVATLCPDLHPDLAALIMRLLAKDPDQRPQSAAEVVRLLDEIEQKLQAGPGPLDTTATDPAPPAPAEPPPDARTTESTPPPSSGSDGGDGGRHPAAPVPQPAADNSWNGIAKTFATMALILLLPSLMYLAVNAIFTIETPEGTLIVKLEGAAASEVFIDGQSVKFNVLEEGKTLFVKVDAGERKLSIRTADGVELSTNIGSDVVTIVAGRETIISARMKPKEPARVVQGGDSGTGVSSPGNYALSFDGEDDYVEIPTLTYDGSHPLTIDVRVTPTGRDAHVQRFVVSNGDYLDDAEIGFSLYERGNTYPNPEFTSWAFAYAGKGKERGSVVASPQSWSIDDTASLAVVIDGPSWRFYTNGALWRHGEIGSEPSSSVQSFLLGRHPIFDGFFEGRIDEVRISRVARYTDDFTPAKRFEPDEQTLALYHFDAADGDVLHDASGNGHHGTIHGAMWVREESAMNVAPPATAAPTGETASGAEPNPQERQP